MKISSCLIFVICVLASCTGQSVDTHNVKVGDILLQDLDCGDACNAIESVTTGVDGWNLSHCGIVVEQGGQLMVVEAYGVVQATPIDSFLARNIDSAGKAKVLIGRPKSQVLAVKSATLATEYVGMAYDDAFTLGDDKYYCSELVYECFKKANSGKEYFPLNIMTFKYPDTDSTIPFWIEYYQDLNQPIPEGEKGINPGAISRSNNLEIIDSVY